ncbi:hypothetical protein ABZY16_08930 [Streptomyces sp. NPDC006553]|nr:hypothetical protein [Streptomyces sp. NBC_00233]MCX5226617.1 hypothetical protein [Streptomyces sp. NBC_00233]
MGALTTAVREPGEAARFPARPGDFEPENEPYEPRLPVGSHR